VDSQHAVQLVDHVTSCLVLGVVCLFGKLVLDLAEKLELLDRFLDEIVGIAEIGKRLLHDSSPT
jgi:hypothetical protein